MFVITNSQFIVPTDTITTTKDTDTSMTPPQSPQMAVEHLDRIDVPPLISPITAEGATSPHQTLPEMKVEVHQSIDVPPQGRICVR